MTYHDLAMAIVAVALGIIVAPVLVAWGLRKLWPK